VTTTQVIELVAAAAIFAAGVWLYRRRTADADSRYGSQGAVILFVIAALLLIHGLGLMEYRPSAAELGQ
jgi:hypothetical protein